MVNGISIEEVLTQLKRILDFKDLSRSMKLRNFLSFVVDKKLKNESSQISAYNIALNVFERDESFDSSIDPIVRVQAGKLRRLLKLYYSTVGKDDRIIIKIPKGAYEPFFRLKNQIAQDIQTNPFSDIESKPTIAVLPFKLLSKDGDYGHLAHGIAEELSIGLTQFSDINVIAYFSMAHIDFHKHNIQEIVDKYEINYLISGNLTVNDNTIDLHISLSDAKSRKQLWANRYSFPPKEFDVYKSIKEICDKSLSIIAGAYGIVSQERLKATAQNKIKDFSAYEAIFEYRQFQITGEVEKLEGIKQALEKAVNNDPKLSYAWAMLSEISADFFTLDYINREHHLEQAILYIKKALQFEPRLQYAYYVSAYVNFIQRRFEKVDTDCDKTIELNPNDSYLIGGAGFWTCLTGNFEKGLSLINKSLRLNPYYPHYFHHAYFLDHLNNDNYDAALDEAHKFDLHDYYWSHLDHAAAHGLLNQQQAANKCFKRLISLLPDFVNHPREYISIFIPFDHQIDKIIKDLKVAGLED